VPFVLIGIIVGTVLARIAKRKARNPVLWFFIGWFPFFGWFAGIYLASLPDAELLRRLWKLEDEIAKMRGQSAP
jgi:hypothetical protein